MTITVTFGFSLAGSAIPEEVYKQLMQQMFADNSNVQGVVLTELPGGHSGLSSMAILLAQATGRRGEISNPLLVRVGSKAALAVEVQNYRLYIEDKTGRNLASQRLYAEVGDHAAIAYRYLRQLSGSDISGSEPFVTLREYLWRNEAVDAPCRALQTLVCETLAQGTQTSGWYNDPRIHQQQRPLWFYNTVLPPAFTLALDERAEQYAPELSDLLALADSAAGSDLLKAQVLLGTSAAYPQLHVVERSPGRLRLVLYEGPPFGGVPAAPPPIDASTLYQPLPAVAARIDLVGPPAALAALPDVLTGQTIRGHIVDSRYVHLRRLHATLPGLPPDSLLDDPIERFSELLLQPRPLTLSVIHGDMNLSNILLDVGAGDHLTAWLIDFDKTTGNGHMLFDAAKLETEYKVHILAQRLHVGELLRLEQLLHSALVQPGEHLHYLKESPLMQEAYQFIATIRRIFLYDVARGSVPPEEYYLALLAYGLAALKYRNLYGEEEHRRRWLGQHPATDPLAQAAYVSAAFAARAVGKCDGVVVTAACYPPVRHARHGKRGTRPWLVGRDELIHQVVRRFDLTDGTNHAFARPIVLLHGQPGSGRGAVAAAIGYELEQRGMFVCEWQPASAAAATVEVLVEYVVNRLHAARVRQRKPRQELPASDIGQRTRQSDLELMLMQLIATLEPPDTGPPPVTLVLHIDSTARELPAFATELCKRADQTAIIIVTDQPWLATAERVAYEVLPLTRDNLRDYVRNERLPLDAAAVDDLFAKTQGMPGLLESMVQQARNHQQQYHHSLKEALEMISETTLVELFFQLLSQRLRNMLYVDALLRHYSPEAAADLDEIYMFLQPRLGWDATAESGDLLVASYRRSLHRTMSQQLQQLIFNKAEEELQDWHEFTPVCSTIAAFYQSRADTQRKGLPRQYLVARYAALAQEIEQAADTLATLLADPQTIYSSYCDRFYALIQEVLADNRKFKEEHLLELAGNCAVYLGKYGEAIGYYRKLTTAVLSPGSTVAMRVLLRLTKAYEQIGKEREAAKARRKVLQQTPASDPIYALARASEGEALIETDPDQAALVLQDALARLEQSQEQWGKEQLFLESERVLLYDTLAYVEMMRGNVSDAIRYLIQARNDVKDRNPMLRAKIENNLGYVYYYVQGEDVDQAQRLFDEAFALREAIGDREGLVKTGQNRANLLVDLAPDRAGWDEADKLYTRFEALADQMETEDRYLIVANHVDALILRGEFERAAKLVDSIFDKEIPSTRTRLLLLLNQAKLALHSGDPSACQEYLDAAQPLAAGPGRLTDQVEWSQLALECHLRLGLPLHPQAERWLAEGSLEGDERQADVAELHFARGLLALAHQQYDGALEQLAAARELWADVPYPHRVGIVAYWQAHTLFAAGDQTRAQQEAKKAADLLAPFGTTPTATLLATLREGETM